MTKNFFDTEFATVVLPDGTTKVTPISIGITDESGRTYYAEFVGGREAANSSEWLRNNVLPHLKSGTGFRQGDPLELKGYIIANAGWFDEGSPAFVEKSPETIAREIEQFCGGEIPEWVASYGAFDFVLLCGVWGGMMKMPKDWPCRFTEAAGLELPRVERVGGEHNALNDACTLRKAWMQKYALPPEVKPVEKKKWFSFFSLGQTRAAE